MAVQDYYETFYRQEQTEVANGLGGTELKWSDGRLIQGMYRQSASDKMTIAEAQDVSSRGEFITDTDTQVEAGNVVRRESDGLYIRLVGVAVNAPKQAAMQIKKITAERIDKLE